jgi:hypothetical protein
VASYVAYLVRHGIARQNGGSIALAPGQPTPITALPGDVGYHTAPLLYAANEMREMASATPTSSASLAM